MCGSLSSGIHLRLAGVNKVERSRCGIARFLACLGILRLWIIGRVEWITANKVDRTENCRSSRFGKVRGCGEISKACEHCAAELFGLFKMVCVFEGSEPRIAVSFTQSVPVNELHGCIFTREFSGDGIIVIDCMTLVFNTVASLPYSTLDATDIMLTPRWFLNEVHTPFLKIGMTVEELRSANIVFLFRIFYGLNIRLTLDLITGGYGVHTIRARIYLFAGKPVSLYIQIFASHCRSRDKEVGRVTGTLNRFLVEPFVPHEQSEEYYICIYTERESNVILFHHEGGVDVGAVDEKAKRFEIPVSTMLSKEAASQPVCTPDELLESSLFSDVENMQRRRMSTMLSKEAASQPVCTPDELLESSLFSDVENMQRRRILAEFVVDLHRVFDKLHFTFLEINPLVVCGWTPCGGAKSDNLFVHILDVAAKLDQCAEFLFSANSLWSPQGQSLEFPFPFGRVQTPEEAHIAELDARTGASMKLSVLNPNGRIWTMSAGGGASVIYADTVCALAEQVKHEQGKGNGASDLANYGEYSGAPSEGQTYEYAKTILQLMTRGNPHPDGKILLIGGGIANFTNVAATFKGIMRALMEFKSELQRHNVRVFVRRAGPNYQEGLRIMRELGVTLGIPIHVFGPETHMTAIVSMAFGLRSIVSSNFDQKTGTEALMSATAGNCDTTVSQLIGTASTDCS
ncbi:hypothetical protein T265_05322 [Opisthorchis viverrini]|uniref:ATP citrate synthase n=1 Tax=Opisthorchis viverrini TaxID=6198 RepID=A0A074ZPH3_OPIVI|nr:hypothetical protein T265_05322 [Opisthorchis viverrini]KER27692.1 hypothetical protein T265_05322 [Opisthorchis viverrini]